MSVLVAVSVPASGVLFPDALIAAETRVRLERVVPTGEGAIPFLWANDGTLEHIQAVLSEDAGVESVTVLDEAGEEVLVRVEWSGTIDGVVGAVVEAGGTILSGVGEHGSWTFELRFDEQDDIADFFETCHDRGIQTTVERVNKPGIRPTTGDGDGVTRAQREAIELAVDRGFFEVPREVTLAELAAELGISDAAVSQRLRRGLATLLATHLEESPTK